MSEKIIEKVRNLLELAYDAPGDEEGQTALLMAQKLMVKHNIAMSDVNAAKSKKNIGEVVGSQGGRMSWWKLELAILLGDNFRCEVIRRRLVDEGLTQIIFFGYEKDAELCTKVYEGALLYLKYRIERLRRSDKVDDYKSYKKSYLLGFLVGLRQRFKEQSQSSEDFALAVQVPVEVLDERKNQLGELKEHRRKMPDIDFDPFAYIEGQEHAVNSNLMVEELLTVD